MSTTDSANSAVPDVRLVARDQLIPTLRVPQARILRALMPVDPRDLQDEWPLLTRGVMAIRAGYSPISGTVSKALLGIKESNKTSGDPHPGIVQLKLVETTELNIDGVIETNYRITKLGIRAFQRFVAEGGKLPPVREPSVHTNQRYAKS